jgi:hypothetical protein
MTARVSGYNNDVSLGGVVYHVQTERMGERIITLIFKDGAVVARGTQDIKSHVRAAPPEVVQGIMKEQHRVMMDKLKKGELVPLPEKEREKIEREEADLIARFLTDWAEEE